MAIFFRSNTNRFRMPPFEDVPQEEDPIDDFCSHHRIVAELGFVFAIFAGVCIQRYEINYESSTATDVARVAMMYAGAAAFGVSIGCLYDDSFLAPKYNYLRPPRRRRRRHRAQP